MGWLNVQVGLDPALMRLLTAEMATVNAKLDAITAKITQLEKHVMAKLDDVIADVTAEGTVIDSVLTLIQGLKDQIANLGLSTEDQAKVDAIFAQVEANKGKLASAIPANTPADPNAPAAG